MLNIWSTVSVLHLSRFINSFSSNLVWYLCSLALSCGWALADGWGTLNMDRSVFNHLGEKNYPEVTIFSCGTARFHRRSISFYEWIENFFIFIWIILCVTKHFILRSNCDRIEVNLGPFHRVRVISYLTGGLTLKRLNVFWSSAVTASVFLLFLI